MYLQKLSGFVRLTRPYILLSTTLFFIGSAFISYGGLPPLKTFISGYIAVILAIASAHTINDFFDWKADAKNPRTVKRPIPSKLISPFEAILSAFVMAISAVGLTFLLNTCAMIIALASTPLPVIYHLLRKYNIPLSFICPVLAEQNIIFFGSAVTTGYVLSNNVWLLSILGLFWETGRALNSEIQDTESDKALKMLTLPVLFSADVAARLVFTLFLFAAVIGMVIGIVLNLGIIYFVLSLSLGCWLIDKSRILISAPTTENAIKMRINAPKYIIGLCLAIVSSCVVNI